MITAIRPNKGDSKISAVKLPRMSTTLLIAWEVREAEALGRTSECSLRSAGVGGFLSCTSGKNSNESRILAS